MKKAACLIIYEYNVHMNVLGIFAQPSKIASSSCFLVFGGFLLIKVFT